MTDKNEIHPVAAPVRGSIRPPGSKSITNRAMVCAALAGGASTLSGVLDSEDTRVMADCLGRLGIRVDADWPGRTATVVGFGGRLPADSADLHVGNSGTTIRFLTAMAALGHGRYTLDGVPRMRQRPIGDLVAALRQLGAEADCKSPGGCPPVVINARGLAGGGVSVRGDVSSQFLSGLLMAAPCAASDVELVLDGKLVSTPYVHMTLAVMRSFGAEVVNHNDRRFEIPAPRSYRARLYEIEPDASAASYFWAAAAVTGGEVTVEGLSRDSLQGDVAFCDCLAKMGCEVEHRTGGITVRGRSLSGIEVDMGPISDTAQTLAAVALFADSPTSIRGVAHIRHKETDRIADLATELRPLGAGVHEFPDGLRIEPGLLRPAEIETYGDHRMAMSLALVGLRFAGVTIKDPACTAKTYPGFFNDLEKLTGSAP